MYLKNTIFIGVYCSTLQHVPVFQGKLGSHDSSRASSTDFLDTITDSYQITDTITDSYHTFPVQSSSGLVIFSLFNYCFVLAVKIYFISCKVHSL